MCMFYYLLFLFFRGIISIELHFENVPKPGFQGRHPLLVSYVSDLSSNCSVYLNSDQLIATFQVDPGIGRVTLESTIERFHEHDTIVFVCNRPFDEEYMKPYTIVDAPRKLLQVAVPCDNSVKNCDVCVAAKKCGTCSPGFYLRKKKCVTCPTGCSQCEPYNSTLLGDGQAVQGNKKPTIPDVVCTACFASYSLSDYVCNQVLPCPGGCTCDTPNHCISCNLGYTSLLQSSSSNPPSSAGTNLTCTPIPCDPSLNCICSAVNNCTQCLPGMTWNIGTVGCANLTCAIGVADCLSCEQNPYECSLCQAGFRLVSGSCLPAICPITNCAFCSSDGVCEYCVDNYQLQNGRCFALSCPAGCICESNNTCAYCQDGYDWEQGVCNVIPCQSELNCVCYDVDSCLYCNNGFSMNATGDCIGIPPQVTLSTSTFLTNKMPIRLLVSFTLPVVFDPLLLNLTSSNETVSFVTESTPIEDDSTSFLVSLTNLNLSKIDLTVCLSSDVVFTIDGGIGNDPSNCLNILFNNVSPLPLITSPFHNLTNSDLFTVDVNFDESLSHFDTTCVLIEGGILANIVNNNQDRSNYTLSILPAFSNGTLHVSIPQGVTESTAGTFNQASQIFSLFYDVDSPVIYWDSLPPCSPNEPVTVHATFSEKISFFNLSEETIEFSIDHVTFSHFPIYNLFLETDNGFITGGRFDFTCPFSSDTSSNLLIKIPLNTLFDLAGNGNLPSLTSINLLGRGCAAAATKTASGSVCLICLNTTTMVLSGLTCKCQPGYYDIETPNNQLSCQALGEGCMEGNATVCTQCWDLAALLNGSNCICPPGYQDIDSSPVLLCESPSTSTSSKPSISMVASTTIGFGVGVTISMLGALALRKKKRKSPPHRGPEKEMDNLGPSPVGVIVDRVGDDSGSGRATMRGPSSSIGERPDDSASGRGHPLRSGPSLAVPTVSSSIATAPPSRNPSVIVSRNPSLESISVLPQGPLPGAIGELKTSFSFSPGDETEADQFLVATLAAMAGTKSGRRPSNQITDSDKKMRRGSVSEKKTHSAFSSVTSTRPPLQVLVPPSPDSMAALTPTSESASSQPTSSPSSSSNPPLPMPIPAQPTSNRMEGHLTLEHLQKLKSTLAEQMKFVQLLEQQKLDQMQKDQALPGLIASPGQSSAVPKPSSPISPISPPSTQSPQGESHPGSPIPPSGSQSPQDFGATGQTLSQPTYALQTPNLFLNPFSIPYSLMGQPDLSAQLFHPIPGFPYFSPQFPYAIPAVDGGSHFLPHSGFDYSLYLQSLVPQQTHEYSDSSEGEEPGPDSEDGKKDKKYACTLPTCGDTFPTRFSLKRHMKRHTGEKPFACDWSENGVICNRRFAEKSTLKRHYRTHTGEKPYKCSQPDCEKTFADRANCHRHELTHKNRR